MPCTRFDQSSLDKSSFLPRIFGEQLTKFISHPRFIGIAWFAEYIGSVIGINHNLQFVKLIIWYDQLMIYLDHNILYVTYDTNDIIRYFRDANFYGYSESLNMVPKNFLIRLSKPTKYQNMMCRGYCRKLHQAFEIFSGVNFRRRIQRFLKWAISDLLKIFINLSALDRDSQPETEQLFNLHTHLPLSPDFFLFHFSTARLPDPAINHALPGWLSKFVTTRSPVVWPNWESATCWNWFWAEGS